MQTYTSEDIKFAQPDDITQILAFGFASLKENSLESIAPANFDKALLFIAQLVHEHVVLVARDKSDPNKLVGVFALKYTDTWWGDRSFLSSSIIFTKQGHRSFSLTKSLVQAAQEYAIINNCPIVFDLFAQKDVEKKKILMRRLGFRDFGSSLIFNM